MNLITLTSDYGIADHDVAAFKGHLFSEVPGAQVIDISHEVAPYNIMEAAYLVRRTYKRFPKGSIHLILVDAHQEADKHFMVLELDGQYFVAADNGVLSLIAPDTNAIKLIAVDFRNTNETLDPEDAIIRIARHLSSGGKPEVLGQPARDFVHKSVSKPSLKPDGSGIIAHVIHIDTFGNLVTNVTRQWLSENAKNVKLAIFVRNKRITQIVDSYYEGPSDGNLMGVFNRDDILEIAAQKPSGKFVNSAYSLLGLEVNSNIFIEFE